VSPEREATALGAGLLAGLAVGVYNSPEDLAATFSPRRIVEPQGDAAARAAARQRWLEARAKSEGTIPELSGISF
jgi:glycerol kinase